jgi:hypothetical protein
MLAEDSGIKLLMMIVPSKLPVGSSEVWVREAGGR